MSLEDFNLKDGAEAGAELTLENPKTGELTEIVIHLVGSDAAVFRNKQKEIQSKAISKLARGKTKGLEQTDDDECSLLAVSTLGWSGMVDSNNDEIKFSIAEAKAIYLKYPSIKEQVNSFIGDRANFF